MNISINDVTIVSSYYSQVPDEKKFLDLRVAQFTKLCKIFPHMKMIIVDDGSPEPLEFIDHPNIKILRIKEDLGFNSHGARNLGVHLAETRWCFLIDLDYNIGALDLESLELEDRSDRVYSFTINSILIRRDAFFSCKGYDEEFVNIHYGDRCFLDYLKNKYNYVELKVNPKIGLRRGRKLLVTKNTHKTVYKNMKVTLQPASAYSNLKFIEAEVSMRYACDDFSDKKILNFEWEEVTGASGQTP